MFNAAPMASIPRSSAGWPLDVEFRGGTHQPTRAIVAGVSITPVEHGVASLGFRAGGFFFGGLCIHVHNSRRHH
jgi:hypothetical protein